MRYEFAPDLQKLANEISELLFPHINMNRVKCFRSFGTSSRRTIARCHALGKLMQIALETDAFYPIEFISERFDKLDFEDKIKVIIHELMHIPKSFGGGFRHHDFVTTKNVNMLYKQFVNLKKQDLNSNFW